MNQQQAIRILMLSPCYWLLDPAARKELIREFCASYEKIDRELGQKTEKTTQPQLC